MSFDLKNSIINEPKNIAKWAEDITIHSTSEVFYDAVKRWGGSSNIPQIKNVHNKTLELLKEDNISKMLFDIDKIFGRFLDEDVIPFGYGTYQYHLIDDWINSHSFSPYWIYLLLRDSPSFSREAFEILTKRKKFITSKEMQEIEEKLGSDYFNQEIKQSFVREYLAFSKRKDAEIKPAQNPKNFKDKDRDIDKYQQRNSSDEIIVKKLIRKFPSFYTGVPITKDKLVVWIKEASKNDDRLDQKRAIDILNKIYSSDNKLDYKHFIEKAKKLFPNMGEIYLINTKEKNYQVVQRLHANEDKNKTSTILSGTIEDIIKNNEYILKKYGVEKFLDWGHFKNAVSFIRYTKVNKNWVHIDALQTDFFNKIRKAMKEADKNGDKEAKKILGEIISKEEDTFKTALSHVKTSHPEVKIWTMSTGEIVKKIEHIQSDDKAFSLYDILPKKLGFKLIPLEQLKKILDSRPYNAKRFNEKVNENKRFFGSLQAALGIKKNKSDKEKIAAQEMLKFKRDDFSKDFVAFFKKEAVGKEIDTLRTLERLFYNSMEKCADEYGIDFETIRENDRSMILNFCHQLANNYFMMGRILNAETINDDSIKAFAFSQLDAIKEDYLDNKENADYNSKKIWWANRGMLNEDFMFKNLVENYLQIINSP